MKIVKLTIDEENDLEGLDAVALVEEPAIEMDFLMFSEHKFASFNDYPQAARKAAEQGIKRNKELGNDSDNDFTIMGSFNVIIETA